MGNIFIAVFFSAFSILNDGHPGSQETIFWEEIRSCDSYTPSWCVSSNCNMEGTLIRSILKLALDHTDEAKLEVVRLQSMTENPAVAALIRMVLAEWEAPPTDSSPRPIYPPKTLIEFDDCFPEMVAVRVSYDEWGLPFEVLLTDESLCPAVKEKVFGIACEGLVRPALGADGYVSSALHLVWMPSCN